MKSKMTIMKSVASFAMTFAAFSSVNAQTNLGADCGCPAVGSRPSVNISSLPGYVAADANSGTLTTGATLTCANTYVLDTRTFVPSGQTINIAPGSLIKGETGSASAATALIISRGADIIANGTQDCPIVFTALADDLSGTYSISNIGQWGGVVVLGTATNNLTFAANGPFTAGSGNGRVCVGDGLGVVEGFAADVPGLRYGALQAGTVAGEVITPFNDADNSGIMRYVSIRHSGANLNVGNEINGLTLASVGSGTTIEHIEIVSCADDNIELFGGNVNLKYITTLFGNDDALDWDQGYIGNVQYFFSMKTDLESSVDSDNGIEADADDQASNLLRRSHPVVYNATFVGNAKTTTSADNSGMAGFWAKDLTEGEVYNSVFANFRQGFNVIKAISGNRSFAAGGQAWHNWTNIPGPASATNGNGSQSLKVVCNTFVGCTYPFTVGAGATDASASAANQTSGADFTQFTVTDMNTIVAGNTLPGFDYSFDINIANNGIIAQSDVIPNPALSVTGCPTSTNGFFDFAPYRGAFDSDPSRNWLSNWSYSQVLGNTNGVQACPADLNQDGSINVNDFLLFAPAWGTDCN
jgi:hypothetical protein